EPSGPRPVPALVPGCLDLDHPIDLLASVTLDRTDRIYDDLGMGEPAAADHRGAAEDGLPARDSPPHIDPGIDRLAVIGIELFAQGRMDAVGGDHAMSLLRRQLGAIPGAAEPHGAVGLGADALATEAVALRPRRGDEGIEQHAMQIGAMDRDLRPAIARRAAELLLIDELAEAVEESGLGGQHAEPGEVLLNADCIELLHRVRQEIDADAERLELRRRFEDAAGNAAPVQHQRKREPADAAADDEYLFHWGQRPRKTGLRFSIKAVTP